MRMWLNGIASLCEAAGGRRRAHSIAPLAACLLALSACGDGGGVLITPGGGDDNPPPACTDTTCGEVRIGLVDADGDFISYTVDVVSIKLERANGSTVQTLPKRQRVDFGDLVDVTEFVTAATIPNGTYVGGTIRLDYTNADVSVEVAGVPVPAHGRGRERRRARRRGRRADIRQCQPGRDRAGHAGLSPARLRPRRLERGERPDDTRDGDRGPGAHGHCRACGRARVPRARAAGVGGRGRGELRRGLAAFQSRERAERRVHGADDGRHGVRGRRRRAGPGGRARGDGVARRGHADRGARRV